MNLVLIISGYDDGWKNEGLPRITSSFVAGAGKGSRPEQKRLERVGRLFFRMQQASHDDMPAAAQVINKFDS